MNTTEFLMIAGAIVPDRPALLFEGRQFTYSQLQERVHRLANGMAELGVAPGDRIATMQVNTHQNIELYFAAALLDAIYVPLNFRAKAEELAQMLEIAGPRLLFLGQRYLPLIEGLDWLSPEQVVTMDCPPNDGQHSYDELLQAPPDGLNFPEGDDDDTTVIMFTSGTTSIPKGVQLTHDSFASYLLATVEPADPEVVETNLLTVPLYHIAGLQGTLAAIYGGRTLAIMRQFEPEEWLTLAQDCRVNRAMLVPTMLKRLMDFPTFREYDLSSLRVVTYGAAPMPVPVIRQAIEEFPGVRFINAFGQTETASTITMLPPEDHVLAGTPAEVEVKLRRLASIGKPLDDVEVMIVDEAGQPVATGEVGEIVARGARMMKGYWQEQAATTDTIKGGWVYTGDLAYQDEDSYIYLAGRARDFIKRGGEMISPEEVEQVLMAHPQVEEAAIIGVPDLEWGEEVRALVVRRAQSLDESTLIAHCSERLSSFKRPRSVVFIDRLPRNVMGKVMKRDLREEYGYPIEQ